MKIGVMTFHWASNYGAVLQAYALVKRLMQAGFDAEDINYLPREAMFKLRFFDLYLRRFANIQRERKIRSFRKKYLRVSSETYHSYSDLNNIQTKYDAVISGSDQIWNESFLTTAEKKPTRSYFLDYLPQSVLRLSYAASFGTNTLTEGLKAYALPALREFDFISVREENAVQMLADEGIEAVTVCDPTLLIDAADYADITAHCRKCQKSDLFNFMLRKGRSSSDSTEEYLIHHVFKNRSNLGKAILTVEQWLWKLQNCDFVVTDSFHCTVFAILFHKPFLAVNDKDCAMNARIKTLAQTLGLQDRVLEEYDPKRIDEILSANSIDWEQVDSKRKVWAERSLALLLEKLNLKKEI